MSWTCSTNEAEFRFFVDCKEDADARRPAYDAREILLFVVDYRIGMIVKKWEYTVHKVEKGVKNHVSC
jgi:hypothetical protein